MQAREGAGAHRSAGKGGWGGRRAVAGAGEGYVWQFDAQLHEILGDDVAATEKERVQSM